jgi:hypothetical protein
MLPRVEEHGASHKGVVQPDGCRCTKCEVGESLAVSELVDLLSKASADGKLVGWT